MSRQNESGRYSEAPYFKQSRLNPNNFQLQVGIIIAPGSALQENAYGGLVLADFVDGEGAAGAMIRSVGIAHYVYTILNQTKSTPIILYAGGYQQNSQGKYFSRAEMMAKAVATVRSPETLDHIPTELMYLVPPHQESNGNTLGNLRDIEQVLLTTFSSLLDKDSFISFISNFWQIERALLMIRLHKIFEATPVPDKNIGAVDADQIVSLLSEQYHQQVEIFRNSDQMKTRMVNEHTGRMALLAGEYKSGNGPGGVLELRYIFDQILAASLDITHLAVLAGLNNQVDDYKRHNDL